MAQDETTKATGMDPEEAWRFPLTDDPQADTEGHSAPKLGSTPERAMEPEAGRRPGPFAGDDATG